MAQTGIPPPNSTPPGMMVDLTPRYEATGEPLRSLGICYINLNKNCDFQMQQKRDMYERAWANSEPLHCKKAAIRNLTPLLPPNRLGSYRMYCNK